MRSSRVKYNISVGSHSRASNIPLTPEQDIYLTEAISDLKEVISKICDWITINIEIKELIPSEK